MNTIYEPIDTGMIAETRNSYSARLLTDPQFEEFTSLCIMLNREIHRSGSFIEKLGIYSFAVSLTEKGISTSRADTIIRDLFKGLFGQMLDGLRQSLLKNEEALDEEAIAMGFPYAMEVLQMIEGNEDEGHGVSSVPFHRAYSHQAALMATQLSITDAAVKKIISEQLEKLEGRAFYEKGKQYEDKYFQPQIQAEKRHREARKSKNFNHETA